MLKFLEDFRYPYYYLSFLCSSLILLLTFFGFKWEYFLHFRWTDTHISPNRTSTCYPEYVVRPETSVIPSSSSFAFTKVRTDCVKDSAQAVQVIEKKSSETFKKNFSDTKKVCETKERAAETSLLKAVKLEDTSLLCDLLNEKIIEDINATDVTGRVSNI